MQYSWLSIVILSKLEASWYSAGRIQNERLDILLADYATLLKLRTLISLHIIGCRKTKLSMERKMFPDCGPRKSICISVVFRHLRNFLEVFRRFPEIYYSKVTLRPLLTLKFSLRADSPKSHPLTKCRKVENHNCKITLKCLWYNVRTVAERTRELVI